MRSSSLITIAALLLLAPSFAMSGGKKENETKARETYGLMHERILYNMNYLDHTWGIKLKSVRLIERVGGGESPQLESGSGGGKARVGRVIDAVLLLEFTKDPNCDPKELRRAIADLGMYQFDPDNVVVGLTFCTSHQGLLSAGKKGDAFRLQFQVITVADVVKIEARPKVKED